MTPGSPLLLAPPPLLRVRDRGVASEVWMQQGEGEPLPVSWGEPAPEDTPDTALGMDMQVGDDEDKR